LPLPSTSSRLINPASSRLRIVFCTARDVKDALVANLLIEGQHKPSSFAQSAKANKTSFWVDDRSSLSHTAVMILMLITQSLALWFYGVYNSSYAVLPPLVQHCGQRNFEAP
jgi:hypothetical protein